MPAAIIRQAADRLVVDALVRGRRKFMEHGSEARQNISTCFDKEWFCRSLNSKDKIKDPILLYYSDVKFREFSVNPLFDEAWYLNANPDVAAAVSSGGIYSGFTHLIVDGLREGRAPNMTMALAMIDDPQADYAPLDEFDSSSYLEANPFAKKFLQYFPILNGYEFYRLYGRYLGHLAPERATRSSNFEDVLSKYFDENYYTTKYLTFEENIDNPMQHYVEIGAAKGHNPSEAFDEIWYRLFYADVGAAVQAGKTRSAFHHYAIAGRNEKRRPKHDTRFALEERMAGLTEPRLLQRAKDIEKRMSAIAHEVSTSAEPRVWFCLPNLNPDLTFGGYKAVYEFIKAVARTGRQIGIFVTEETADNPEYFLHLEKDKALRNVISNAIYVNRLNSSYIKIHSEDIFVVYSVWDNYVVQQYLGATNRKRFLLFAQEYEPIFYECGSARALTEAAYAYPHVALFNSRFLTNFFRDHQVGVFADAAVRATEGEDFHVFEHMPTRLRTQPLSAGKTRRTLVFYARPEMHAARNLFELGYLALRRLCSEGVFDTSWDFFGLGGLGEDHELPLSKLHSLQMKQKIPLDEYEKLVKNIDVGLSLMFAPHPSVVPFEFAATGAVVVTNTYENRTANDLRGICENIVPCEATIDGIARALREAVVRANDVEMREARRLRLASHTWDDVFTPQMLEAVFASLDRPADRPTEARR